MKKPTTKQLHTKLDADEILKLEQDFIDDYCKNKNSKPLKILLSLFKGYYGRMLLAILFCTLKMLPTIFIPIAISNIIDVVASQPEDFIRQILINFLVATGLLLLNYPFHMLYTRYLYKVYRLVEAGLRGAIMRKLQVLTVRFTKAFQSGRIQSKILRDVESVITLCSQTITVFMEASVRITVMIIVIASKRQWQIMLFFLVTLPIAIAIRTFFKNRIAKNNSEYRKTLERTSSKVVDSIEMMPITRAHAVEEKETADLATALSSNAKKGYQLDKVHMSFSSINWITFNFFRVLCLVFSAFLALAGKISIGDVNLYNNYFTEMVSLITQVVNLIPVISKGTDAIISIGEILSSDDTEKTENKQKIDWLKGSYEFRNVRFGYEKDKPILKGLNLRVKAGETIAIVGESGAGKSTILNLVTGFYFVDDGELLIDGKNIKDIDLKSYRKKIAIVPQSSVMFTGTIRENITYGIDNVSDQRLQEVITAACLDSVIKKMPDGVDTYIGEKGGNLSGGQRQRVSIARAIIRNPRVIILDEATSALDTVSEKEIQQALNNLTEGKTTFIVAHRLSTIRDADKIAVMENGKCVEFGTYDELLAKKGKFYNFRKLQV